MDIQENQNSDITQYTENGITYIVKKEEEEVKKEQKAPSKEFLHGIPKSNKPWKKFSHKFNTLIKVNKGLNKTWEEKQKLRNQRKELLEKIKEVTDRNDSVIREKKLKQKENKKRKELNDFKSGQFQLIKNTKKINKWSQKARKTLTKLPSEIYEQVIKKEYGY